MKAEPGPAEENSESDEEASTERREALLSNPKSGDQNSQNQSSRDRNSRDRKSQQTHRATAMFILLLLGLTLFISLESLLGRPRIELAYSDFMELTRAGKVKSARVGKEDVFGEFKEPVKLPLDVPEAQRRPYELFYVQRISEDEELPKVLLAGDAQIIGAPDNSAMAQVLAWGVLLLLMFVGWFFMLRRLSPQRQVMSFGRSKARVVAEDEIEVRFKDVAGIDEAREELQELILFLNDPGRFERLGARIPRGVLLVGSPGTGKTLLAKAVAGEAQVPFFSLSGSDFVEMFAGVGASRVRDLFEQAQRSAPCIIFIDELDAIGKVRGIGLSGAHDEREQTLNQLLAEMDGFDTSNGVIILAASNRPEILDPALLRAGRFDRQVVVERPDINGRRAILQVHMKKVRLSDEVDADAIARLTPGFVGADLANLVNEAALLAARRSAEKVERKDFGEALERIVAGLRKRQSVMTPDEKRRIAIHETGHALVALACENTDPVHRVSVIARGAGALGYTLQVPEEERFILTQEALQERLKVLLGGRVAEKVVLGDVSTGAADDLRRSLEIARRMVTEFGMTEAFGAVAFGAESRRSRFLKTEIESPGRDVSEATFQRIDEEIQRLIAEAESEVLALLSAEKEALEAIAKDLSRLETLEQQQLLELAKLHGARVQASKWKAQSGPLNEVAPDSKDEQSQP
jgi:cell division protease FtsH